MAFEMISPVSRVRVIEVCRIKDGYALNNGSIHLQNVAYEQLSKTPHLAILLIHPLRTPSPQGYHSSPHTVMKFLICDKTPS
ncbi:hypothetical protein [Trichococcus collinsii]|uniref:hypothetical protein n=1 Tax=Trichococcus collinsii TaxID=157076 RepID=UPI00115F9C39|nr:hypothetical protein [Trichococcus collinsii]